MFRSDEPTILFLGTSSTKTTILRGASAIYVAMKDCAVLMDCAEGTYGQLFDHLGTKEKVDEALLKTRVIFVTH